MTPAAALARRPDLWLTALRLIPPRWWRRRPPWPAPPAEYRSFRTETMYGRGGSLTAEDLIRYLEWCRAVRRRER